MREAKINIYISKLKQGNFILIFSEKNMGLDSEEQIVRDNQGTFSFQGEGLLSRSLYISQSFQ